MQKILHVDDDEKILRVVAGFLQGKGYQVISTTQPFIAPLIRQENPDLLLMDIGMPLLSGDKLVQVLKSHDILPGSKILFLSGQSPEAILKVVMQTGVAGFVRKDEGLDRLLAKIRSILGPIGFGAGRAGA